MIIIDKIAEKSVEVSITTKKTETSIIDIYGYKMFEPSNSPIRFKINVKSCLLHCNLKYTLLSYTVQNTELSDDKETGIKHIVVDENERRITVTFVKNYQVFIFEGILLIENKIQE